MGAWSIYLIGNRIGYMTHGPNFMVHLVLKVGEYFAKLRRRGSQSCAGRRLRCGTSSTQSCSTSRTEFKVKVGANVAVSIN